MSTHLTPEELELAAKGSAAPAHLTGCAECRAQVASAKARLKLLGGLKNYTLGDAAFGRAEANVLARVKEEKGAWGGWRLWLPLGVAAAAALAAFMTRTPEAVKPVPQLVKQLPLPPKVAPKVHAPLTVALAAGAERHTPEGWQVVHAGDVFKTESEVRAGRLVLVGELLMLDGAPVRLLSNDALAQVEGESGRIDVDGRNHERVVRVGPRWIKGTDAAYLAVRAAAAVDLDLRRGEVWVADDAAFTRPVKLTAPARMHFGDGAEGTPVEGTPASAPAWRPHGALRFDLEPKFPLGDRVSLDDQFLGGAPLSMFLPPGRHKLRFFQGDKLLGERWVLAQESGAALEEPKPVSPRLPVMPPDEQQRLMALAINAQKAQFSACYEKWLKNDGRAGGSFSVGVVISERGKVKSASVSGAQLPEPVKDCVKRTATGFKFPAVGEEVELEIPVQMSRQ